MRERLTLAFVVVVLSLLLGAFAVRAYSLSGLLREHESERLASEAVLLGTLVQQRSDLGQPVDREWLEQVVAATVRIEFRPEDGVTISAEGDDYRGGDAADDLSASAEAEVGSIRLSESGDVVADLVLDDLGAISVLALLTAALAGGVGWLVARAVSAPFRRLADAAAALGRGRFDLDLPRTRIPEARAIASSLAASAEQMQRRLRREQEFAEHASHVLRTPLTGLRLELEELTLRSDVPDDAREVASRGLVAVQEVDTVAGELVDLSRKGLLVETAGIPLRDLATQVAQRWADELADHDRTLTAAVEGDIELTYTPGPVEHILDLLLVEVVRRGAGAVRMVFEAAEPDGHLTIRVVSAGGGEPARPGVTDPPVVQARAVVVALGGRLEGESPMDGLEVLLPRR